MILKMNKVTMKMLNGSGHSNSILMIKITTKESNLMKLIKNIYYMIKNNLMRLNNFTRQIINI
jgi:hypothetical protein